MATRQWSSTDVRPALTALLALLALGATAQEPPPGGEAGQPIDLPPPAALERLLAVEPERGLALYGQLALALGGLEGEELERLRSYLTAVAQARGRAMGERGGPYTDAESETLLVLQLVDPPRFAGDPEFRTRAMPVLLGSLDPQSDSALRERQIRLLTRLKDFSFVESEQVELAWGTIRRSTRESKIPASELRLAVADSVGRIVGSFFSLPSRFFDLEESEALLRGVRRLAPERALIVLADQPLRGGLEGLREELDLTLIDTRGRPYSPWARDPMSFRRGSKGQLVILLRPNLQVGREADARLGLQLLQNLPEDLHSAWGPVGWSVPPVPFHNGQILPLAGATWISIHSLEQRIHRLLSQPSGMSENADASRRAAMELERLYGLPARFVHSAPGDDGATGPLAGGAGFDLDSLLTLLPRDDGITALVGSLEAGVELVRSLSAEELEALRGGYGLAAAGEDLRSALVAAHQRPRATGLQQFTDNIQSHLANGGLDVEPLPLLLIPTSLLERGEDYASHSDFLVTWNNVVLEHHSRISRAEGFASLIPSGDRIATDAFARAKYRLELLPPLIESVLRYGGYRCASNHVR